MTNTFVWSTTTYFVRESCSSSSCNNKFEPYGTDIFDVNGDAFPDIVKTAGANQMFFGSETGFTMATSQSFPTSLPAGSNDNGVRLGDFDGNGFMDFIQGMDAPNATYISNASTSNPTLTWSQNISWPIPSDFLDGDNLDQGYRIFDMNGDGFIDLNQYREGSNNRVHSNLGPGWVNIGGVNPEFYTDDNYKDTGLRPVDIQNDGLTDLVKCGNFIINKGTNPWVYQTVPNEVSCMHQGSQQDNGARFIDLNSDGLADRVIASQVYINRGGSFILDSAHQFPLEFITSVSNISYDIGTRVEDINGDGLVDVVQQYYKNPEGVTKKVFFQKGKLPDVLKSITSTTGAKIGVEYKMSQQYRDQSNALLNPKLPASLQTVSKITVDDRNGNLSANEYIYEGGSYYSASSHDRRFAGFNIVTKKDSLGNAEKTYYHQGNTTDTARGEFADHISKLGKPYRVERYDASGNLYSDTINKWDRADLSAGVSFVKLVSTTDRMFDGDSDHKDRAQTFIYDDVKGVPMEATDFGEVVGAGDGAFTDVATDKVTTYFTYSTNASSTMVMPRKQQMVNAGSNQIASFQNFYDGDSEAAGTVTKGNLTRVERWVGQPKLEYINSYTSYDGYGNVASETEPNGHVTTYEYDEFGLYPTKITNALGHEMQYEYDFTNGQPSHAIDANGVEYFVEYDMFDRIVKELGPDNDGETVLLSEYTYDDIVPRSVSKNTYLSDDNSIETIGYLDALGRFVQERTETEYPNIYTVKDTVYDIRGLKANETLPHFAPGKAQKATIANPKLWVSYSYDALGRVTAIANAIGTTTNTYDDWKLTVTDARGVKKDLLKDGRGNLVSVVEYNGPETYTTVYTYNGKNNLTKITDALGNVRSVSYDGVDRRYSVQDLHASGDSTFSTWFYDYDASGNVIKVADGKLKILRYEYDELNRPLTEANLTDDVYDINYEYDAAPNGLSKLYRANTPTGYTEYEYNMQGRVSAEITNIDEVISRTEYEYDRQGNILKLTLPDTTEIMYEYNVGGRVEKITALKDGEVTPVINAIDYSPEGKIVYQYNGNKTRTYNTYDSDALYRLSKKVTVRPEGLWNTNQDLPTSTTEIPSSTEEPGIGGVAGEEGGVAEDVQNSFVPEKPRLEKKYSTENAKTMRVGRRADGRPVYQTTFSGGAPETQASEAGGATGSYGFGTAIADGYVFTQPYPGTWAAQIVDTVGRSANYTSNEFAVGLNVKNFNAGEIEIYRAFMPFDTSALPDDDNGQLLIMGADLQLRSLTLSNNNYWNDPYSYINVYQGFQASTTQLLNTDIDACGNQIFNPIPGSVAKHISTIPSNSTTTFAISFQGAGWINTGGFTKLCLREGHDVQNAQLDITNTSSWKNSFAKFASAEHSVAEFRPKLIVTWFTQDFPENPEPPLNPFDPESGYMQNPSIPPGMRIQDLSYFYDKVGNITKLIDSSDTDSAKQVVYGYDDLNRLLSATSTNAKSGENYQENYAYNAIGNILSTTGMSGVASTLPAKTYLYGGNTGNSFANPHAVTSFAGAPVTYDKNGNTLSGFGRTFTWDYHNRLAAVTLGTTTTTFAYNHAGDRVKLVSDTTTLYPNQFFNITLEQGTTTNTIHIMNGEDPVATLETIIPLATPSASVTRILYTHDDHLGGSAVSTDTQGNISELTDYYPYGTQRISYLADEDQNAEQRKFTGHEFDPSTGLTYMKARYYNSDVGRFLSVDPVYRAVGTNKFDMTQFGLNPQSQNSYSYANNNPITITDPTGEASFSETLNKLVSLLKLFLKSNASKSQGAKFNSSVFNSGYSPAIKPTTLEIEKKEKTNTWDPLTDKRISELDPRVQVPARKFINNTETELGVQLRITTGYRSAEEQNALYMSSRTNPPGPWRTDAMAGQSYHNYGLAIDVVVMSQAQPDWKTPVTQEIAAIAKQEGFEWGGDWKNHVDKPHFEMTFGQHWSTLMKNSQ